MSRKENPGMITVQRINRGPQLGMTDAAPKLVSKHRIQTLTPPSRS